MKAVIGSYYERYSETSPELYEALESFKKVHGIQPRNDRVLIRRIEEPETVIGGIIVPDVAREKALKGEVLAVGPGKWIEGTWWKFKRHWPYYEWEWIAGYRETPEVKPGQIVLFNAKWNDLASTHYDDDKSALFDPLLHLVQEADVLGILPC